MGAYSTRVVSILDGSSVLFIANKKSNRRVRQKKVGDPTSGLAGIDCYCISLLNRIRIDAVFYMRTKGR